RRESPSPNVTFMDSAGRIIVSGYSSSDQTVLYQDNVAPRITATLNSGLLTLSWTKAFLGWRLENESAIGGAWKTLPGSENATSFQIAVDESGGVLLFRLVKP